VGDTVARVIYFVLGIVLFVLGIDQLIGANWF
jgi:preprotein translocase subunit SecE